MKNLYDVLGINKDATKEEIKKAHRNGVKKNHPDKGGDAEMFQQIQLAYDVLGDEQRRDKYDTTGETDKPRDVFAEMFASFIDSLVSQLETSKTDNIDLIELGNAMLEQELVELTRKQQIVNRSLALLEKALGRMDSKKGNTLMQDITRGKIKSSILQLTKLEEGITFYKRAMEELQEFIYNFEEEERPLTNQGGGFWHTFSTNL
jgi:curved DNA-binding protein CbpA